MKTENLTISLPYVKCNKKCPYCISEITPKYETNRNLVLKNIDKVKTVAKAVGVKSVLFTGNSETLLSEPLNFMIELCQFFKEFPLEIQTNGYSFIKNNEPNYHLMNQLMNASINTIAFSIDNIKDFERFEKYRIYEELIKRDINIRLCVNCNDNLKLINFIDIINYCKRNKIQQLLIRKLTYPDHYNVNEKSEEIIDWIKNKSNSENIYNGLIKEFRHFNENNDCKTFLIRKTCNNTEIWDVNGVSLMFSLECIQEYSDNINMRSLIFHEDGHLYTSWGTKSSMLF